MYFNLKRPCPKCPFRKDCLKGWLGRPRAEEIAEALVGSPGRTFACHQTTTFEDASEGEIHKQTGEESHCVGAIILIENEEAANQMIQIAERLELFDPDAIDDEARDLIFMTREEFEDHHADGRRSR